MCLFPYHQHTLDILLVPLLIYTHSNLYLRLYHESLVTHSHLSQISLMLAVKEWVNQELIPRHLQQGVLNSRPSQFDRRYFPTVDDLRNMTRHTVKNIRNNMLDQDALETLLKQEQTQSSGLLYYLRKYQGKERNADE